MMLPLFFTNKWHKKRPPLKAALKAMNADFTNSSRLLQSERKHLPAQPFSPKLLHQHRACSFPPHLDPYSILSSHHHFALEQVEQSLPQQSKMTLPETLKRVIILPLSNQAKTYYQLISAARMQR